MKNFTKFLKKCFYNYAFTQIHYISSISISAWMIGLCLSILFLSYVSNSQVCETPNNNQAVLFQPCTWHIGNDAGPLRRVAESQNYNYAEYTDAGASLSAFVDLSGTGLFQVGSHGLPNSLLVEAYTWADRNDGLTAFLNYLTAGYNNNEITLSISGRQKDTIWIDELLGIDITDAGIRKYWKSSNSIVFIGACFSFFLGDDFDSREYFGYLTETIGKLVRHDSKLLYGRMDGTINKGNRRPAGDAFAGGGYTPFIFKHRTTAAGRTTLAPRVINVGPLECRLPNGIHHGWVEFDTRMTANPAASVLTMQIFPPPDVICNAQLINLQWTQDNKLEFDIDNTSCNHTPEPGDAGLGFTVHNGFAVSKNNERELDGGWEWCPIIVESGIGPNRDDFFFKRTCAGGGTDIISYTDIKHSSLSKNVWEDTLLIIEDSTMIISPGGVSEYSLFTIKSNTYRYNVTFSATDLVGASGIILKDSISFQPDTLDLSTNIEQTILMRISIPSGLTKGNYLGKVSVVDYGEEKDSITIIVNINQFPILTLADTLVSVAVGDTVKIVVKTSDSDGDSTNIEAIYPWGGWFENIGGDSLVFCFSPDSLIEGLSLDAVFFATDGKTKIGKPLQIEVFRSMGCLMHNGWNMVSVPLTVTDYQKTSIYPTGKSEAFTYKGSYVICDTLDNGTGYWVKFSGAQSVAITGYPIDEDSIDVSPGWNMIGSITYPVDVSNIIESSSGMVISNYFEYNGTTYIIADSIHPGKAYWVKTNQAGQLILSSSSSVNLTKPRSRFEIDELPPPPPESEIRNPKSEIPTTFALEQNYPNPFNPITTFKYQLPVNSNVKLTIYDVLGQKVATLVDGIESAGYKSLLWNASDIPSGIYFYRIEAVSVSGSLKTFNQVKKMLLLK